MSELHDEINSIVDVINDEIDSFHAELRLQIEKWIDERIAKKAQKDKQNEDLNDF